MKEESNGELAFPDNLLKCKNGMISPLVQRRICILTNTSTTVLTTKHVVRSVVFSLFNNAYSIITNKDEIPKENFSIKQEWVSRGH